MSSIKSISELEFIMGVAKKYNHRSAFKRGDGSVYKKSCKSGQHDEVCAHMNRPPSNFLIWDTIEKVIEEVLDKGYRSMSEFAKGSSGAHDAAYTNGWLDKVYALTPIEYKNKRPGHWKKIENIIKEIKEKGYATASEFERGSSGAYEACHRYGYKEEVYSHFISKEHSTKVTICDSTEEIDRNLGVDTDNGIKINSVVTESIREDNILLTDYLLPKFHKLINLGETSKGIEYEKLASEIFKQLGFDVTELGQGSGRNPDAILRHRDTDTAFIVDAKAYSSGYSLNTNDERAIHEYVKVWCNKLQNEGYKKIGFIIVSNSFNSNFDKFTREITWDTDIKRFILLRSEALLNLLAYKTKEHLSISRIIECIIKSNNPIKAQDIIDHFNNIAKVK